MAVGAYVTAQFHGPAELMPIDIVNIVNSETAANGQFAQMLQELKDQHLSVNQLPTRFRPIPAQEAPTLMRVMQEFDHHLEEVPQELPNVWGALVITDNQRGLKRLDWVVSWDGVEIEGGEVRLDEDGNPIYIYARDSEGQVILDENGRPLPQRRVYSEHLFIHENSAYFD